MNEVDFNEFDFDKALKYDKRPFKKLYLSFILFKHPLISLFKKDYNIFAIKLILFIKIIIFLKKRY